ncbi:DNA-binding transcriptional regulator [Rhizobium sp. SSA_523]|uniref:helix-turn-helix domain-containing protein n=1 Tax=Rhizobium sp. SSA_523 TaxID=2952477 RepID=UPI0020903457|nr:transcriptional regulator [Rhizobium sp. SSA_523]MCO5730944.1 transcriptional regulator [Rhizobium sp. SSA_523]WKC24245.1 transcriptional regulator [Rhizobium sp. SSA_523]
MSRILKNVHTSAERLRHAGFVDDVTMREFDALCLPPLRDYSPEDIKRIRAGTKASQAVFASFINVKKITVAAWEQGTKKPSSTAVKILDLVERKGLDILR